jgi:hypothetical protein
MHASAGRLSELNKVTLVFIPGHLGISSTDKANRLAKEGAIKDPPNQATVIPFSVGKKLKRHFKLEHQTKWVACTGCY